MKLSVIFGVLQMTFGIIMKGLNAVYFKRWLEFGVEFIPQIIILWALFGWMDILIIGKWATPKYIDGIWPEPAKVPVEDIDHNDNWNRIHYSPPIITTFIDIFLSVADNTQEITAVDGTKTKELKYFYVYGEG